MSVTPQFVPWADGATIEFIHSLVGKVCVNRLWLLNRSPPNGQAAVDDLVSFGTLYWIANMMPLMSSDINLALVRATTWDSLGGRLTSFITPNVPGGIGEESYSANVAIRVGFVGPTGVAIHRNGNFFPGLPDSAVDGNLINPGYMDSLFEAYVGIIDDASTWGTFPAWRWSVVSLEQGSSLRSEIFARRVVSVVFNSPYISPQRKRLR